MITYKNSHNLKPSSASHRSFTLHTPGSSASYDCMQRPALVRPGKRQSLTALHVIHQPPGVRWKRRRTLEGSSTVRRRGLPLSCKLNSGVGLPYSGVTAPDLQIVDALQNPEWPGTLLHPESQTGPPPITSTTHP